MQSINKSAADVQSTNDFLPGRAQPTANATSWANRFSTANYTLTARSAACALVMTAMADWCIYQSSGGYAGWSVFLVAALVMLYLAVGRWMLDKLSLAITSAAILAAAKLVWQGSGIVIWFACLLLILWSMRLQDIRLGYRRAAKFTALIMPRAIAELPKLCLGAFYGLSRCGGTLWLTIGIPVIVCAAFACLFVMANPEFSSACWQQLEWFSDKMFAWAQTLHLTEILFWGFVGCVCFGLTIPAAARLQEEKRQSGNLQVISVTRYQVGRNTLIAVNVLFAAYLIIELISNWSREYADGFHYSGYAHEGAAWLTIALGLTTVVLGLLFGSNFQYTDQVLRLRRLAIAWVGLNWLLAVAAYHRLFVYVDYNGLTRMRIIGFLGIACVMLGLIWAIRKIDTCKSFGWMVTRQFSTMLCFIFLYCVIPVDWIAHRYNVSRINSGHPQPLVQFTEQRLSDEALLCMARLIDAEDAIVRDGIRAILADRMLAIQDNPSDWRHFQGSRSALHAVMQARIETLQPFADNPDQRQLQWQALKEFAYQWY